MASVILLVATLRGPTEVPVTVEVLELNHQYRWCLNDDNGYDRVVEFEQWIAWHRYPPQHQNDTGIHVWCWLKHEHNMLIERRHEGGWRLAYLGAPVHAKIFRETWTESDPEVRDSRLLPKTERRTAINGWRR